MEIGQIRFSDPAQNKWAAKVRTALRNVERKASDADARARSAALAASALSSTDTPVIDDDVESPTVPQNFEAIGGFSSIFLQWDMPTYSGHQFTRIYRASTNAFGDSVWIADVVGKLHSDTDLGADVGFYYWARHVNVNGEQSALHDVTGVYAQTARSYASVIEEAREDVLAALRIWQDGVGEALEILDNQTLALILESNGAMETLSQSVIAVQGNAQALYDETVELVASEVGAAVTKVETLAATLYETDGEGELQLDSDNNPIFKGAFIESVDAVMASVDGALMAAIGDTLKVQDGNDNEFTLSQIMSLSLDTSGNLEAQWGIKTTIENLQYGVGLVSFTDDNDEQRVGFHVATHTFAVYNPANGESVFPLIINDSGDVLINSAIIDRAVVSELVADQIITEELFANKEINSPVINAGKFFGGELNINDKTLITPEGALTAVDADIAGKITATEGELDNVVIKESCEVLGQVSAANIVGDVLDRYVVIVQGQFTVGQNSNYTLVEGYVQPGVVGPHFNRTIVVSGIALDHQNGGGSSSNFDVVLYVNGEERHRFGSHNVNEEGSVTPVLGALLVKSADVYSFRAALETGSNDNILVQQSAITIDITKAGDTLTDVNGLYEGSNIDDALPPPDNGSGGTDPEFPHPDVEIR